MLNLWIFQKDGKYVINLDLVKLSMLIEIASVTTKKSIEHICTSAVTEKKWNKKTKSKRRQKKGKIRSRTKTKARDRRNQFKCISMYNKYK